MTFSPHKADRKVAMVLVLVIVVLVIGHTCLMSARTRRYLGVPLQVREWANMCTMETKG